MNSMTLSSNPTLVSGASLPKASGALVLWNDYTNWNSEPDSKRTSSKSAALVADQTMETEKTLTRALLQHYRHPHHVMFSHRTVEKRKSGDTTNSMIVNENVHQNQQTNHLSFVQSDRLQLPIELPQNRSKAQKPSQRSSSKSSSSTSATALQPILPPPYFIMNGRPITGGKGRIPLPAPLPPMYPPDLSGYVPTVVGSHGQLEYGFYGRDYGRAHFPHVPVQDTSVNWHSLLQLILLALMATGGTIGSIFIISSLTVIENFQIRGSIYLVSVALANLLIAVIALPCSCVEIMAVSPNHPDVCAVQWFLTQMVGIVTLLTYACISIENLALLAGPRSIYHRHLCSRARILILVVITWALAIAFPAIQHFYHLAPDLCQPLVQQQQRFQIQRQQEQQTVSQQPKTPFFNSSFNDFPFALKPTLPQAAVAAQRSSQSFQVDKLKNESASQPSNEEEPRLLQLGEIWPRYHLCFLLGLFCIPQLISWLCFARCALRVKELRQRLQAQPNLDSYLAMSVYGDCTLVKTNVAICIYASLSWCPLLLCASLVSWTGWTDAAWISAAWWMAWTFSCVYSFLYAVLNRDFGDAFFKLFYYCCCKSHVTFARKSLTFRRPLGGGIGGGVGSGTMLGGGVGSGESIGLRVHIIPGLNMAQRRNDVSSMGTSGNATIASGGHVSFGSHSGGYGSHVSHGGGGYHGHGMGMMGSYHGGGFTGTSHGSGGRFTSAGFGGGGFSGGGMSGFSGGGSGYLSHGSGHHPHHSGGFGGSSSGASGPFHRSFGGAMKYSSSSKYVSEL